MEKKNNGGKAYDPDRELEELFNRYHLDDKTNGRKKSEAPKKIDNKGISMNSRVPSGDHYKNINVDKYEDVQSGRTDMPVRHKTANPQSKNLSKKKPVSQDKISQKYQTNNANHSKPKNKVSHNSMLNEKYVERLPKQYHDNDINTKRNTSNKRPNQSGHNENVNRSNTVKRKSFKHKMRDFKVFMKALFCFIGAKIVSPFTKRKNMKAQEYINDETAPRYKGEVYFNNHNPQNREVYEPTTNESESSRNKKKRETGKLTISKIIKKPKGRKRNKREKKLFFKYISIMVVMTIIVTSWTMSCLNDVFAFNKKQEVVKVVIPKDAKRNDIVKILKKDKLITHKFFCKFVLSLTSQIDKSKEEFLPGVYYIRKDIGVENMLKSFKPQNLTQTVTVSIPEGFTIDQIAERLEKNKVCSKKAFYGNLDQQIYDYGFAKTAQKKNGRYHDLEGYLFPDTYQFYVGDNPSRVVKKMLGQFNTKWTSEFEKKAKAKGMTVDEVITLASIIQKEALGEKQMKQISSVFHNRLKKSSSFPTLQSDATAHYVNTDIKDKTNKSKYDSYLKKYDTYQCTGLPVGAICNPGEEAIRAALEPDSSSYMYFCHDTKSKRIYLANTLSQQEANQRRAGITKK